MEIYAQLADANRKELSPLVADARSFWTEGDPSNKALVKALGAAVDARIDRALAYNKTHTIWWSCIGVTVLFGVRDVGSLLTCIGIGLIGAAGLWCRQRHHADMARIHLSNMYAIEYDPEKPVFFEPEEAFDRRHQRRLERESEA